MISFKTFNLLFDTAMNPSNSLAAWLLSVYPVVESPKRRVPCYRWQVSTPSQACWQHTRASSHVNLMFSQSS